MEVYQKNLLDETLYSASYNLIDSTVEKDSAGVTVALSHVNVHQLLNN